ncbi:MAG: TerB family tellurite resistance protein [Oceanospirillales bacterium]|nr:TerB family tellurite resistance protein [Oceanospirillales bacterium]
MTQENKASWTEGIEQVVANELQFKAKLDIGEDAFKSLRLKRYLLDALDAGNGAITGAAIAKSSFVASSFFAPSGLLGVLGIGTAVTPLGWAIAAGALGAGLSVIIGKKFVRGNSSQVKIIPDFINTPLDLLAVGLFDMIATLGLKMANIDGPIDSTERAIIEHYFIDEWGYDRTFTTAGLDNITHELDQHSIQAVAQTLADYKKKNPDCNYKSMSAEILRFLDRVMAANGVVDEREQIARNQIKDIFDEANAFKLGARIGAVTHSLADGGKRSVSLAGRSVKGVGSTVASAFGNLKTGKKKPGKNRAKD